MNDVAIHYEVYVRRKPGMGWSLELATEDRAFAVDAATERFADGRCIAAKVSKETLDPETRQFKTVTILNLGDPEPGKKTKQKQEVEPLCVTPQDLYTVHARERIGRLLDGWLRRNDATAFELLHRADLAEKLEGSGIELQHALQKISIPEAEARDCSVHEMIRTYLSLVERTILRLLTDARKGRLPVFLPDGFAAVANRLARDPEGAYLLGTGVAAHLSPTISAPDKIDAILDLADAAPASGPGRALALSVLEQPLAEILGSRSGFLGLLTADHDLGGVLAAMTRLAGPKAVGALMRSEASVAREMPELSPGAQRLAAWLDAEEFTGARAALGRKIIEDLNGGRRLRPTDAEGEIHILRALAMALTAAADNMLPPEDVQAAFSTRSKMLVTSEFVDAYLGKEKSAREEVEALIWLTENVIGGANKRQAGQWLRASVASLRLEKELRQATDSPAARLAALAGLQRAAARCGLVAEDYAPIQAQLGHLGGLVEADAHLTSAVARAKAPAFHRLSLLLRLANGESAPLGPAADRAKAEALKLARADSTRDELAKTPDQMEAVRSLLQASGGLAA